MSAWNSKKQWSKNRHVAAWISYSYPILIQKCYSWLVNNFRDKYLCSEAKGKVHFQLLALNLGRYLFSLSTEHLLQKCNLFLVQFLSLPLYSNTANDLPSLMEEARLLELQAHVYQKSGNAEETLKTLTRAKEVQTRWDAVRKGLERALQDWAVMKYGICNAARDF